MEYSARIAPDVDRLVLAVNTISGSEAGASLRQMADAVGLQDYELLKHYAEFLLAGRLSTDLALRRVPYQPPERVRGDLAAWQRLGLVEGASEALVATRALHPLLEAILESRAAVATRLWAESDYFPAAAGLIGAVSGRIPAQYVLAAAHAALPVPPDRYLGFHHRLTTLRYARSHAHVEAWRSRGLDRTEIMVLTALWHERPPEPAEAVGRLGSRGLIEGGSLTVAGLRLRQEIEAATNQHNAAVFASLDEDDRENLLVSLAMLPGEPL